MILSKILAEEGHQTTGKALAGDDSAPRQDPCRATRQDPCWAPDEALAKGTSRVTARPTPTKLPPPFTCRCQPNQLGGHLRGNMQPPGQLIKRLRGGMQIFVKAPPPRHLSCLPAYMAPHASLAKARVEARRSGDGRDGPRPNPQLSRGTPKLRIKCVFSCNTSDKLRALYAFPPPVCHCGSPFRL